MGRLSGSYNRVLPDRPKRFCRNTDDLLQRHGQPNPDHRPVLRHFVWHTVVWSDPDDLRQLDASTKCNCSASLAFLLTINDTLVATSARTTAQHHPGPCLDRFPNTSGTESFYGRLGKDSHQPRCAPGRCGNTNFAPAQDACRRRLWRKRLVYDRNPRRIEKHHDSRRAVQPGCLRRHAAPAAGQARRWRGAILIVCTTDPSGNT